MKTYWKRLGTILWALALVTSMGEAKLLKDTAGRVLVICPDTLEISVLDDPIYGELEEVDLDDAVERGEDWGKKRLDEANAVQPERTVTAPDTLVVDEAVVDLEVKVTIQKGAEDPDTLRYSWLIEPADGSLRRHTVQDSVGWVLSGDWSELKVPILQPKDPLETGQDVIYVYGIWEPTKTILDYRKRKKGGTGAGGGGR